MSTQTEDIRHAEAVRLEIVDRIARYERSLSSCGDIYLQHNLRLDIQFWQRRLRHLDQQIADRTETPPLSAAQWADLSQHL